MDVVHGKPRKEHMCRSCGVPMKGHFCVRKYFPEEAPPAPSSADPPEAKRHKPAASADPPEATRLTPAAAPSARLRASRSVDYKDVSDSEESEDSVVSSAPAPPTDALALRGALDGALRHHHERLVRAIDAAVQDHLASVSSDDAVAALQRELDDLRAENRRERLEHEQRMNAKCDEVASMNILACAAGDQIESLTREIVDLRQRPTYDPPDSVEDLYDEFVCTVARAVSERHATLRQAASAAPSSVVKQWCVMIDTGAKVALPASVQTWVAEMVDRLLHDLSITAFEKPCAYSNTLNGTTHHYDIRIQVAPTSPRVVERMVVWQRNRATNRTRTLELVDRTVDVVMNEATYSLLDENGVFVFQKVYDRMRELKFSDTLTVASSAALEQLCDEVHAPFDGRFRPSHPSYTACVEPSALWNFLCAAKRKADTRNFFVWMHGTSRADANQIVSNGIDVDQNVVHAAGKGFYCASNSHVPFHFANRKGGAQSSPAIVVGVGVYDQDSSFRTDDKNDFIVKRYRMRLEVDCEPAEWAHVDNAIVVERPQQCALLPLGSQAWTV